MSGNVTSPTKINDSTYESNIRYAVDKFQTEDIITLIEPINLVTRPKYYMCNVEKGIISILRTDIRSILFNIGMKL